MAIPKLETRKGEIPLVQTETQPLSATIRKRFVSLLEQQEAIRSTAEWDKVFAPEVVFDLDKLWETPEALSEASEVFLEAIKSLDIDFDTFAVAVSGGAPLTTLPLVAQVSPALNKRIIVFQEEEFATMGTYPISNTRSFNPEEQEMVFSQKKFLIIDGENMWGNWRFEGIWKRILGRGGEVRGALLLVDYNRPDHKLSVPAGQENIPIFTLWQRDPVGGWVRE